jgi:putative addiction module killer protein
MIEVRQTEEFSEWFKRLRDLRAKAQIIRRLERLEAGSPGDVEPTGEGVSELRIDYGPGYRLYFTQHGLAWVLLLCGGDKKSQRRDIARAKMLKKELGI